MQLNGLIVRNLIQLCSISKKFPIFEVNSMHPYITPHSPSLSVQDFTPHSFSLLLKHPQKNFFSLFLKHPQKKKKN